VSIRFDPDAWSPRGADFRTASKLKPGEITVWERQPYRVVEIRERQTVDWPKPYQEAWIEQGMPEPATWHQRPIVIVLRDLDQETAKPRHICGSAYGTWYVLPEHYSICRLCHEIPPCTHVHTETVMERASERMAKEMAILPGCCHSCHEPITHRQKTVRFTGPNLIRPDFGDDSAVFHLRGKCLGGVEAYDKRWAKVTGSKCRFHCEGHQMVHLDGSMTCTELEECPGDVNHRSREWHHPEHRQRYARADWCWCLAAEQPAQLRPDSDALF
jgi:hypothetical protein